MGREGVEESIRNKVEYILVTGSCALGFVDEGRGAREAVVCFAYEIGV